MRKALVLLCAACYALLTAGFADAAQGVCSCDDMAQIQRRIDETGAAISAYTDQYLKTSDLQLHTDAAHKALQAAVQKDLNGFHSPLMQFFATNNPADTDVVCNIAYNEPTTACIHEALQLHENIHAAACKKRLTRSILLKTYIQEEIDGYAAEHSFLMGERRRLLCSCPYFALRVENRGTAAISVPMERAVSQSQLTSGSNSNPGIELPLKFEGGAVTGKADAVIATTASGSGLAQCNLRGGFPLKLDVKGNVVSDAGRRSFLHVDVTGTPDQDKLQGQCVVPGKTVSVDTTSNNARAATIPFDIYGLDSAAAQTFRFMPGATSTVTAEAIVAEPYPNAKASNGRGSTVGEALHQIGMPDCK